MTQRGNGARSGRPDATGRSSGKFSSLDRKVFSPPADEPWFWHTTELVRSPSWRKAGIHCRRLLEFLQVEHRSHAGLENGNLQATYDQLVRWGIGRRYIHDAIEEAEFLGLIRCDHGGRWAGTNKPSRYRLTFYADRERSPPTNEWLGVTAEAIEMWRKNRARVRAMNRETGPRVVSINGRR